MQQMKASCYRENMVVVHSIDSIADAALLLPDKRKKTLPTVQKLASSEIASPHYGEHKMTFRTSINGPGRSMIQVSCRPVIENKTHSAILVA